MSLVALRNKYGARAAQSLHDLNVHLGMAESLGELGRDEITSNWIVQLACEAVVIRCGESARRALTAAPTLENDHPELELRRLIGMRAVFTHDYHNLDYESVFETFTTSFPAVGAELHELLFPDDGDATQDGDYHESALPEPASTAESSAPGL